MSNVIHRRSYLSALEDTGVIQESLHVIRPNLEAQTVIWLATKSIELNRSLTTNGMGAWRFQYLFWGVKEGLKMVRCTW